MHLLHILQLQKNGQKKFNQEWKKWWITDQGADEVYMFNSWLRITYRFIHFLSQYFWIWRNWKLVDYIKDLIGCSMKEVPTSEKRGILWMLH